MLHPALTRFMAVLLAILCLALLASSYFGLSDAQKLREDDVAAYNKLNERIASYEQLSAELAELEEYKKADEKLSEQEQEHDSTASQHRTDLAEHTAKEGAFKMGADALWEAKAQIDEQKILYNYSVAALNQKEKEFQDMKTKVQGLAALADGCSQAAANAVPNPGEFTVQPPELLEESAYETPEAYQNAKAAYEKYQAAKAQHEMLSQMYQKYTEAIAPMMQGGAAALAALGKPAPADIGSMAQALQQAYNDMLPLLDQGEKGLAEGKAALEQAAKLLYDSENKIQGQLELIWYQMGQSDEQALELAEEKEQLQDNSAQLQAERELLEEQKEKENRLRSTRIILMKNKTIEERVNAGGELAEVSRQYAQEFKAQYEKQYEIRRVLCRLGMAAGVLGLLMLPAAFELIRSRVLLLLPAFLSLLTSALAETLSVRSGEGQFYTAIPVIFFSLFYVLAARGRKKVIRG